LRISDCGLPNPEPTDAGASARPSTLRAPLPGIHNPQSAIRNVAAVVLLVAAALLPLAGCASRETSAPRAEAGPTPRDAVHGRLAAIEDEMIMAGRFGDALFGLRVILSELNRSGPDEGWQDELRARAMLWIGWCTEHIEGPAAARIEYEHLLELYPTGPSADHARRLLEGLGAGRK
jgi:hypothetical protein